VLALCLVSVVVLGLFLVLRPGRLDLTSVGSTVQTVAAGLTAAGTLWAGAVATARFMLWQSTRSARFFEHNTDNPVEQVAIHFGWLIQRLSRPLLVVIDDLDRCRPGQVVELLESVQTLLRDAPPPDPGRPLKPVAVVVAADSAWLHQAFEREYEGLGVAVAEPGKPLAQPAVDEAVPQRLQRGPGGTDAGRRPGAGRRTGPVDDHPYPVAGTCGVPGPVPRCGRHSTGQHAARPGRTAARRRGAPGAVVRRRRHPHTGTGPALPRRPRPSLIMNLGA
jgi:hypothetical protein